MARWKTLSATDFESIGQWKDAATSNGRWKENVASVAFVVWKQIAAERPACPAQNEVRAFLVRWENETYTDQFKNGFVSKCFGLSRATTLLHFVSGGAYPIYDSRVQTAVARLGGPRLQYSTPSYLDVFCPFFQDLAELCDICSDLRTLDKALFAFGAYGGKVL